MINFEFEWDINKENINKVKHGINFEEAKTVFDDLDALCIHDPDSLEEDKFLILGLSCMLRLNSMSLL